MGAEGTEGTKAWRWDQGEELEAVTGLGVGRGQDGALAALGTGFLPAGPEP